MVETTGETAGGRRPRFGGDVRISEDEWVKDEKTGELRLSEKGVTRQKEDILALAEKLGVDIVKWYEDNDTTAFKKKRIRLPNGRSVWRVIRPEFREMLADYEDGKIDGVIFYDLDRLARQPRDLEDLIDLAEYYKRPVATVTGELDLRTSNGRTMARVLVAMANKSSEDTSRRVARARLQQAQQGHNSRMGPGRRRFGYDFDRSIIEAEAELIRAGARRILAGESWVSLTRFYRESGIPTVGGGRWGYGTIRQIYLTPTIAGIAVYNGAMRKENQEGHKRTPYADPESVALKDAAGNYVRSADWEPILSAEVWKALISEWHRRREGKAFSAFGTRKYLLSGLLRCGRILDDGTMCNRSLSGGVMMNSKNGKRWTVYRCPNKSLGGCAGTTRATKKLDPLIEELLFAHITANAPRDHETDSAGPGPDDPDVKELADVQRRLFKLRTGYAQGTVTDDTMFNVVPQLEARERKLKSELAKKAKIHRGRKSLAVPVEDVRREWDTAANDIGVRRAILSRYIKAIVIRKSTIPNRRVLDYSSIEPIWRTESDPMPDDFLIS
jgi:DNA invertase Pin-like site-specific DNA recombinase